MEFILGYSSWKKLIIAFKQFFLEHGHMTTAPKCLNSEWLRLSTYADYPQEARCSALLLARQGFVFIGQEQCNGITIACIFCFTVVRNLNLDSKRDKKSIENLHPSCGAVSGRVHENSLIKGEDTNEFYKMLSQLRHLDGNHEHNSLSLRDDRSSSEDSNLPTENRDTQRYSTSAAMLGGANNIQEDHNTLAVASTLADSMAYNHPYPPFYQATYLTGPDAIILDTSSSSSPAREAHPTHQLKPQHPSIVNIGRTYTGDNNALCARSHQVQSHLASSDIVTNRAQNLSLPWQRGEDSENVNGDIDANTNRNHTFSTNAQNASDPIPTANGASASISVSQPPVEHSLPATPQTSSASSSNSQQNQNDNETLSSQDGTLSYEKLGIMTARPKRLEFVVPAVRLESFQGWPQGHHIQPLALAQAGFFYTGYSDCARCFYCGGGLRNWEEGDDVWVEHARWFPKCTFVRQNLGQAFIDVVQDLNKEQEMIPYSDVIAQVNARGLGTKIPQGITGDRFERDSNAYIPTEEGFIKDDVIAASEHLKKSSHMTTAPKCLNSEWLRLSTYADYPQEARCSALLLARQGFVFIGQEQCNGITIACIFCFTVVRNLNLDSKRDKKSIENLHPSCGAVSGRVHENSLIKGEDTNEFYKMLSQLRHLDGNHEHNSLSLRDDRSSSEDSNLPTENRDTQRYSTSAAMLGGANNIQEDHNTLAVASTLADSMAYNHPYPPFYQATYLTGPDAIILDTSSSSSPAREAHPTHQLKPQHPSIVNIGRTYTGDNNALCARSHQVQSHLASSDIVTNRAQNLSLPWQRGEDSENVNGDIDANTNRNHTFSTNAQNASDPIPTANGASASISVSQPPVEHSLPATPQTSSASSSNSQQNQNDNETLSSQDGTLSYEKLGIMTARPKRLEFVVPAVRLESFQGWPQGHHIQPLALAQAGFFYTGYSDCARCFYCGGGLRNWEEGDDVWVEHARWFPKCTFVRQNLGQAFIDVVQDLNKEQEMIPYSDVIAQVNARGLGTKIPQGITGDRFERDSNAYIPTEEGFIKDDVIAASEHLKKSSHMTTAPKCLNSEWLRLSTYADYPQEARCSALLLARQGFVFIGQEQCNGITIACIFCFTVVRNLNLDSKRDKKSIENLHPSCGAVSGRVHENSLIKGEDTNEFYKMLSQLRHLDGNHEHNSLSLRDDRSSSEDSNLPTENRDTQRYSTSAAMLGGANNIQEDHNTLAVASTLADSMAYNHPYPPFYQATYLTGPDAIILDTSSSSSPAREAHPTHQLKPQHPSIVNIGRTYTGDNNALCARSHQVQSHLASSDIVTNRAQNLSLPWQRGEDSENVNGDIDANTNRNHTFSTNAQNASDPIPTANGASASISVSQPPVEHSLPATPQTSSASSSNSQQNQNDNETLSSQDGTLSYEKLGIMTARPKRLEFVVPAVRLESFQGWPQGHHIQPLALAQAGFFYTGYSDCARCFYCGGGLRNWEEGDDVWVEHARWFPKCTFVRQNLGQAFIDVVQDLNKEQEMIPYSDVIAQVNARGLGTKIPQGITGDRFERDSNAYIPTEEGFIKDDVIAASEHLKKSSQPLSADLIYHELVKHKIERTSKAAKRSEDTTGVVTGANSENDQREQEKLKSLRDKNNELRQQSQCKICMDKEVAMIFLPCGHFVSCIDCCFAFMNCFICNQSIKGVVRGKLA